MYVYIYVRIHVLMSTYAEMIRVLLSMHACMHVSMFSYILVCFRMYDVYIGGLQAGISSGCVSVSSFFFFQLLYCFVKKRFLLLIFFAYFLPVMFVLSLLLLLLPTLCASPVACCSRPRRTCGDGWKQR